MKIIILISFIISCQSLIQQNFSLKSFGNGLSFIPGSCLTETTVFEYNLSQNAQQGVITYLWMTGLQDKINETLISMYIDEGTNSTQKFQFMYYHYIGIGFGSEQMFDTTYAGKAANTGAVYNMMRVPFGKSIKVTIQFATSPKNALNYFYIQVRGVENLPINFNGVALPLSARLNLQKNENVTLQPLQMVDFILSPPGKSGVVYSIFLQVESTQNLNFLEGCVRVFSPPQQNKWILATGTEDYFQSAYYFNGGQFHHNEAGMTFFNSSNNIMQIALYKNHINDALYFDQDGFQLTWRNGDTNTISGQKCIDDDGIPAGNPQESIITTYGWFYTW